MAISPGDSAARRPIAFRSIGYVKGVIAGFDWLHRRHVGRAAGRGETAGEPAGSDARGAEVS